VDEVKKCYLSESKCELYDTEIACNGGANENETGMIDMIYTFIFYIIYLM
jgi:hypothetical protein